MPTTSATTQTLVDQLRQEGLRRGLSPQEIETALARHGYVQAPDQSGGLGRILGLGARGVVQGAQGVADLNPFGAPQRIAAQMTGVPLPTGEQQAGALGLPQPATPGERVGVAAMEGVTASVPFGAAGAVPKVTGAVLGAGAGAAGQTAEEMGAGPLGQIAASLAVGGGVPIVGAAFGAGIRAMLTGARSRQAAAREALALLQAGNPDAPATLGQVATGGAARSVEGTLRNFPGASATFKETLDDQARAMRDRATGLADRISAGGTSPEVAGTAIQIGLKEGYIPRFKAAADYLYRRVFRLVPPETRMQLPNTGQLIHDMSNLRAAARPLKDETIISPRVAAIFDDLDQAVQASPEGLQFQVVKELRSRLGAMLNGDEVVADINLRDVKRLYGALSQDMRRSVAGQGDDALRAWDKAEDFYKQGIDKIEKILQPLINKKEPEKAFLAMMSGTRDGAFALRTSMRSLRGEERRIVASTVVRRLGLANPSAQDAAGELFSPETFLTRWSSLHRDARAALFEGIDPAVTEDLNRLAKAMEIQREASKVLKNPSGTTASTVATSIFTAMSGGAVGLAAGQGTGGAVKGAATALAGLVAAKGLSKMFTNPRMVRWFVKQTKVPMGALTQELAILAKDAQKWDPESQALAMELIDAFKDMDWRAILLAKAAADATATQAP